MICWARCKARLPAYDGALQPLGEKALEYGVRMSKRIFDDAKLTDHHAIIPTGKKAANLSLTADERRLYELVAKRLAAVFYPNYEYDALRVITACGQDRFLSTGQTVTQEGWKAVYAGGAGERAHGAAERKKRTSSRLPDLHPGDERVCRDAEGGAGSDQAAQGIQRREHSA